MPQNKLVTLSIVCFATLLIGAFFIFYHQKRKKEEFRAHERAHWIKMTEWYKAHPCNSTSKVFLGNSLTEGFDLSVFNDTDIVNRGISGDHSVSALGRLQEITDAKPAKIFIELGINEIKEKVPLIEIEEHYAQILIQIITSSPQTKIYVQSILPVDLPGSLFLSNKKINKQINEMNEKLKKLSQTYKVEYIDIHTHVEENNSLKKEFTTDGIHLSAKGYSVWYNVVKPYL